MTNLIKTGLSATYGFAAWILGVLPSDARDDGRFGEADARRLRALRMRQVTGQSSYLMITNITNAVLLTFAMWGAGHDLLIGGWLALLCVLSLSALVQSSRRGEGWVPSGTARSVRRLSRQTAGFAVLWTLPAYLFASGASGYEAAMLVGLMAGMMAGCAYVLHSVPRAAFTWVSIQAVANIAAFLAVGGDIMLVLAAFTFLFALVIVKNVTSQAEALTERFSQAAERERVVAELAEQRDVVELLLREYESHSSEWMWQGDARGYLTQVPQPVMDMMGVSIEAFSATRGFDLAEASILPGCRAELQRMRELVRAREPFHDVVLHLRDCRDGTERRVTVRGKPLRSTNGSFIGYRGIATDVTDAALAEERVHFLATRDTLTELHNRSALIARLEELRAQGKDFAYAQVDLDRFKAVNDALGHPAGDELLVLVADILRDVARHVGGTEAMAARLGGDEFALILPGRSQDDAATIGETVSSLVVERMERPFELGAGTARIGASVGLALMPGDADDLTELYGKVDIALYRAKAEGRGTWRRFTPQMQTEVADKRSLEEDLRGAVAKGEMRLVYQPIVRMDSAVPVGMEALLRWRHPVLGDVSPEVFVPVAEESGAIFPIGEWVLRQACAEAAGWDDERVIAVNVSARQLTAPGFAGTVMNALAKSGLPAARLEIEMTETALAEDPESVLRTITALRDMGISIALDDFGTGYASLSYLHEFVFDRIKIDRSFVSALVGRDAENAGTIVRSIVELARGLGIATTAEGVERDEQSIILRDLGCIDAQGWLFGRPEEREAAPGKGVGTTALRKPDADASTNGMTSGATEEKRARSDAA